MASTNSSDVLNIGPRKHTRAARSKSIPAQLNGCFSPTHIRNIFRGEQKVASAGVSSNDLVRSEPLRVTTRVVSNEFEGEINRRIVLETECWPAWQPGQFVMLSPGPDQDAPRYDPLLPRPMAIFASSEVDGKHHIEVLYKVEGRGTQLLGGATEGDHVRLLGPLGTGFGLPAPDSHAILVGGGTGTASLYGLARAAKETGRVTVILGARREGLLMAADEIEKLGVDVCIVTEDGSRGEAGLVTDALAPLIAEADAGTRVYACGPTAMMRACAALAAEANVRCDVALENRMACGFGVCLGCAVPMDGGGFSLVCTRGPVYDATELDWPGIP
ncbi:MAG: dihydroorotate dehydrogenase electron transfer subunit [Myxococcota bacterium]